MSRMLLMCLLCLGSLGCIRLMESDPDDDSVKRVIMIGDDGEGDGDGDGDLGPLPGPGESCDSERGCDPWLVCVDGVCRPECTLNAECATGHCELGRCTNECEHDFECADVSLLQFGRCEDGRCVDFSCDPAGDNPNCGPYACNPETKSCFSLCQTSRDCAAGYVCDGSCVKACTRSDDPMCKGTICNVTSGKCGPDFCISKAECAAGYECLENHCVQDSEALACSSNDACGGFACKTELNHCATHCIDDMDCAEHSGCARKDCVGYSCFDYDDPLVCRPKCSLEDESACGAYRCEADTLTCRQTCLEKSECAAGHSCDFNDYTCKPDAAPTACTSAQSCGNYTCGDNGNCFTQCMRTADCAEGMVCRGDRCALPCTIEDDPTCGGFQCDTTYVDSVCNTTCDRNTHCASGYQCQNQTCELAPLCEAGCGKYACNYATGRCHTTCETNAECTSTGFAYCGFNLCN